MMTCQFKTKSFGFVMLIALEALFCTGALAQNQSDKICVKYCSARCDDIFPKNGTNTCEQAKIDCNCERNFSLKDTEGNLVSFYIIPPLFLVSLIVCCGWCYRVNKMFHPSVPNEPSRDLCHSQTSVTTSSPPNIYSTDIKQDKPIEPEFDGKNLCREGFSKPEFNGCVIDISSSTEKDRAR